MLSQSIRILFVEDDPLVARAAMHGVERHAGLPVATTITPTLAEALGALKRGPFDLVLLDLNLPDSRGLATLEQMAEHARATPIIVFTGQYDENLPDDVFALGAQEYLPKEFAIGSVLWRAIHHTVERARSQQALRDRERELRKLSARFVDVQEAERRRLARWLHDELGQSLTALQILLDRCAKMPASDRVSAVGEANAMVAALFSSVRALSLELRPVMLDDLGLLHALLWFTGRFTSQTGLVVEFAHDGLGVRLEPAIETAAYRIVQTALTNIACHADTDRASLRAWVRGGRLRLEIGDAGRGFVVASALARPDSFGLASMRERAGLLGGEVVIESAPGTGTRVSVDLPATAWSGTP